jgi:hypothetical protein
MAYNDFLATAAADVLDTVDQHVRTASAIEAYSAKTQLTIRRDIVKALRDMLKPSNNSKPDGRAVAWNVRVRLADAAGVVLADTDPEHDITAPGEAVVLGLPNVAEFVSDVVHGFHAEAVPGATYDALRGKLTNLRMQIYRGNGDAAWRVAYAVQGEDFNALVNVRRVEAAPA